MKYRMEYRIYAGFPSIKCKTRLKALLRTPLLCVILLAAGAVAQAPKPLSGYEIVKVDKVTVDKTVEKFPAGYDTRIQEKIVDELRKKKVFPEVINTLLEENDPPVQKISSKPLKTVILSTRIIEYKPGNRALRYTIGWGTGATKIKAQFTFLDAESGRQLFTTTRQGKFLGFVNIIGPGRNHAATESSGDLIDALIREINKQR